MKSKRLFVLAMLLIASISTSNLSFAQENLNRPQTNEFKTVTIGKRNFETPAGYNDNDYQKLVTFLESSNSTGTKNGYELNPNYDPLNPDTWTGITWVEVSQVKRIGTIDINKKNISGNLDLTGLSNLNTLKCYNTQISSLDLTGLSELQILNCSNTEISSLDLKGLSNLKNLSCYNTQISSLDLTELLNLQVLGCSNTKISSLDLKGLSELQNLNCSNTKISSLDLAGLSNLQFLYCYNCKIGINELKRLKLDYPKLFNTNNLKQNIFDSYLYVKGDIIKFGNEKSIYKWYIDGQLIDLSTSVYDLSEYAGRTVKCEIIDGDITLTSNQVTLMDISIKFENPPKAVIKGNQVKLSIIVKESQDYNLDKSVSLSVYNSTASSISTDGILNVPADETSSSITVRATSNFDNTEYAEIEIKILSPSKIDLKTDKASYTYGDIIVLNASVQESKAKTANSNKISFYNGATVLGTEEVVNNQASIQVDTKDLGTGTFNLKADFSGNDILASSTANIDITVDKAKLNSPTGVKWNGMTATFNSVDNCSNYEIQLFRNGLKIKVIYSDLLEYDFTKSFIESGDYCFSVKALGNDNYADSEASTSDIYTYSNVYYDNLQKSIEESKEISNKTDATVGELMKAVVKLSRSLREFEESQNK